MKLNVLAQLGLNKKFVDATEIEARHKVYISKDLFERCLALAKGSTIYRFRQFHYCTKCKIMLQNNKRS